MSRKGTTALLAFQSDPLHSAKNTIVSAVEPMNALSKGKMHQYHIVSISIPFDMIHKYAQYVDIYHTDHGMRKAPPSLIY